MVGALGVNQRWLFTVGVRARHLPRRRSAARCRCRASRPTSNLDLALIGEAFVVVVVGGMGIDRRRVRRRDPDRRWSRRSASAPASSTSFGAPYPARKLTLVAEFLVMAVVLVVRPGACSAGRRPRCAPRPSERRSPLRRAALRAGRRAGGLSRCAALLPLAGRRLRAGADDRHADRRAVRGQPALPHGPGRHAFVRPRRLLRPRRLRRGAAASSARGLPMELALVARAACAPRSARSSSAGSACACRASTWRC